ncbi:TIGR03757 family integrating conjugative element protein [Pseudomonas chlororaphis]|uniref:TIGR03757 family integrating conjugative element protein n=1 Tax=Pseudomonas chlororaphis TaxID=587753 RepID=UPI0004B2434C|nr:TIGR03757 family integrating conjugative element protein [Pseudomonas chlororaphis]
MNQRSYPFLSGLVILAWLLAAHQAVATEVWIVTDVRTPVTGRQAAARVIEIDASQRIEEELGAQLPTDPQLATSLVRQRLEGGGAAQQQRLRDAYQGTVDAWSLGITKVPAVVVDQRYVVYGEQSLDKALARIARYRGEQP